MPDRNTPQAASQIAQQNTLSAAETGGPNQSGVTARIWQKVSTFPSVRGWRALSRLDRRRAILVAAMLVFSTLASLVMIGSVMPFLAILSDPDLITENQRLASIYAYFGFEDRYRFLVMIGLASAGIVLISNLIQITNSFVVARFTHGTAHSISLRLMYRYLSKDYEYFLTQNTADMSQRVLSEASQFVSQIVSPSFTLLSGAVSITLISAFLLVISPGVTLAASAFVIALYVVAFVLTRPVLQRIATESFEANREKFKTSAEALGGIKEIKVLGREAYYVGRYETPSELYALRLAQTQILRGIPGYAIQTASMVGIVAICLVLVPRSTFESGDYLAEVLPLLVAFGLSAQRLLPQIGGLYRAIIVLQACGPVLEAVAGELNDFELPSLTDTDRPILPLKDSVAFDGVSYSYPGSDRTNLEDISFAISKGERIGIVGATGAGKTTLVDLMLGLIEPTQGQVLVDGTALDAERLARWKRAVGYVPQGIFLSDTAVRENIALGLDPAAIDDDRVRLASRIAKVADFIEGEMPQGYLSEVGERGVRLSGGQRQRIGIARALYHDAEFIVFDEATSALDNLTEREVMQAIDGLPGDKTLLLIAHRLSTVRRCDKIMVLDKGRLVGFAPWDELMAHNETFRRIAEIADTP